MSFNTNYILPGDDKNQILGKVNYNFSQILANAVGLPGEMGIKGPTGIIGQVGKDGDGGATGTRANLWFIQEDQPYGNIPYNEAPLINYDIWVNVAGGGIIGQAGAVSLGVARALLTENENFEKVLRDNGLLTRDSRKVERKKYGRHKARRSTQFSKR